MTDERLREALQPARAGGKRRLTFDNGRYEEYQAVFVTHPSGEWDRILIARDDGSIARLIADLINGAATPEPTLDVESLARVLHPWLGTTDMEQARVHTRRIAAEYARLSQPTQEPS